MPSDVPPAAPFGLADLPTLGLTRGRLRRLISAGKVIRVARGVYASADEAGSIDAHTRAIQAAVSAHHVVVDRSAAWLHGIDAFTFAERSSSPPVETCTAPGRHATERIAARGRSRVLVPDDVMTVDGVRVTTPLRTALDLGCHLRRREAFAALCAFAREYAIGAADLDRVIPRFRGRRGVIQLRSLIPLVTPAVESHREAWTLLALLDAGLPMPTPQLWILVDGIPTYRLDFAYEAQRVAVEYDGEADHSTTDQRAADQERRAWLEASGWTVIVVRRGDFTGAALDRWLAQVRAALRPTYTTRRW